MLLTAVWRMTLALLVLQQGTLAAGLGAVVVHWRRLDGLVGWAALLVWWMGTGGGERSLRQARRTALFAAAAGMGMALAAATIAWDQFDLGRDAGSWLARAADVWLAAVGLVAVVRELRRLSAEVNRGVDVMQLWRMATAQWVLAWIGAAIFLRFWMSGDELLGNESARQLLFVLPGVGVLLNVLMTVGIRWWVAGRPAGGGAASRPRVRAWVVAMAAVNVGALLLVMRPAWLGVPGGLLLAAGVAMYLVGFGRGGLTATAPGEGRRGAGGQWLMGAWAVAGLSLVLVLTERVFSLSAGGPVVGLAFFGAAWRHLLAVGAVLLWAVGTALIHARAHGWRLRSERLLTAGGLCVGIGVALTTGTLLAASLRQGEAQLPILKLLWVGAVPEALGVAAVGAGLVQARAGARPAARQAAGV
jgi:hypothetical protein